MHQHPPVHSTPAIGKALAVAMAAAVLLSACSTVRNVGRTFGIGGNSNSPPPSQQDAARPLPPSGIAATDMDEARSKVGRGLTGDAENAAYSGPAIPPQ